jgi:uracil-DNA glycosylase
MIIESPLPKAEPPKDCALCPRLVAYRHACQAEFPPFWNAPVPAFGDPDAWLAIIGLAPGKHGANRTGRPFTGDFSGDLLFATLAKFDLLEGEYNRRADDGVKLKGVIILNAVKCLPPENKPTPEEIRTCRPYLGSAMAALPKIRTIIALGEIGHQSALKVMGAKLPKHRFAHGATHNMLDGRVLIDSYHCSRYNQNTKRLTVEMFEAVFATAVQTSSTNRP